MISDGKNNRRDLFVFLSFSNIVFELWIIVTFFEQFFNFHRTNFPKIQIHNSFQRHTLINLSKIVNSVGIEQSC